MGRLIFNKCEYCEEGICTYFKSLEEQYADEEDGLPADYCCGTEEDIKECGLWEGDND